VPAHAVQRLDEAARGDREAEARAQDRRHLREGHAEPRVQPRRPRERARPDLRRRGARGARRLARVAALRAAPAASTPPDVDVEGGHVRPYGREIGLVLDGDALGGDRAAARGARRRRQHLDDLVDVRGDGAPRAPTVRLPRLAAGAPRARTGRAL
jgi:hypothetical protein